MGRGPTPLPICQVSVFCCSHVPRLLPATPRRFLVGTPLPPPRPACACWVTLLSPDLPWWEVSPFKCPFPEQPVLTLPGHKHLGSAFLSPSTSWPRVIIWVRVPFSLCGCGGLGGRGSLFQSHIPLVQSFPIVVLTLCPLLPVDDGILAVQGCQECQESMGHLQIWPADLGAACKNFLAFKKREKKPQVLARMWRRWNPPTQLAE